MDLTSNCRCAPHQHGRHHLSPIATFAIAGTEPTNWTVTGPSLFADPIEETLTQAQHATQAHAGLQVNTDWYDTPALPMVSA